MSGETAYCWCAVFSAYRCSGNSVRRAPGTNEAPVVTSFAELVARTIRCSRFARRANHSLVPLTFMVSSQPTCLICATALSMHQVQLGALCGSAACEFKHRSTPASQRCAVCQRLLEPPQMARRVCANRACEREWMVDRPLRARREQRRQLIEHTAAFRNASATEVGVPDADTFSVTLIPYSDRNTIPLPASRRDAIRAHLTRTTAAALERIRDGATDREPAQPARVPVASSAMSAVLGVACGACRGKCCSTGGEHAYITSDTMLAYIERHPDHTLEQVVHDYMAPIHAETMELGCVYQYATGCALPRTMRSVTCNTYFCESLVELQVHHAEGEPVRAFFAPEDTAYFGQGVFVSQELVAIVKRTSSIGAAAVLP